MSCIREMEHADDSDSSCAPTPASWIESCESPRYASNPLEENSPRERDRRPWLTTPLDPDKSQIRILKLRKGSGDQQLTSDLSVANLDEKPDYEVLSYVWGDPKSTEEIMVRGVPFQATRNLADFLRCLRLPDRDRTVWADAICIDQGNAEEKGHQIGLMTEIYRHAKDAHVWFGPFNSDAWFLDLTGDSTYTLAVELEASGRWTEYERLAMNDLKYFVEQDGFVPIDEIELKRFGERCEADVFTTTLAMLDKMAEGGHLYTYPVFSYHKTEAVGRRYRVNRSWLLVMDCIHWLLQRPWWSRVWTLQEAVLPKVDPIVHAPPYSFRLSRLLDGVQSMIYHNNNRCCKWFGAPVTTSDRYKGSNRFGQAIAVLGQREELEQGEEGTGVALNLIVSAIQARKATEVRDYWFGLFGFLPTQWQELSKSFPGPCTTAGLFCQFSKLLYFQSQDLTYLDTARRGCSSEISDLPSWTIDLTSQRHAKHTDYDRWILYDASLGKKFDCVLEWPGLKTPSFTVQAIRVASVQAVTDRILPSNYTSSDLLLLIQEWKRTYNTTVGHPEEDAFWRAVFMDANVQMHWMSRRKGPLIKKRLDDIKLWYRSWSSTRPNDPRDLGYDRKSGGTERGLFHYRAVQRNADKTRFFVTSQNLPGMGPFDMIVGDEVYALKGCKALVILRPTERMGERGFLVVGLCFVDRWMYGRAAQGNAKWEEVQLF